MSSSDDSNIEGLRASLERYAADHEAGAVRPGPLIDLSPSPPASTVHSDLVEIFNPFGEKEQPKQVTAEQSGKKEQPKKVRPEEWVAMAVMRHPQRWFKKGAKVVYTKGNGDKKEKRNATIIDVMPPQPDGDPKMYGTIKFDDDNSTRDVSSKNLSPQYQGMGGRRHRKPRTKRVAKRKTRTKRVAKRKTRTKRAAKRKSRTKRAPNRKARTKRAPNRKTRTKRVAKRRRQTHKKK